MTQIMILDWPPDVDEPSLVPVDAVMTRDGDSVTHRAACPRLQPEYRYPSDECDLCPTPCMCPESQLRVEG